MVEIKGFKGFRPPKDVVLKVASRPYDVLNSKEAKEEAADNEYSLLHITKPEIDLPEDISEYDERVYNKAKENFEKFIEKGFLKQDNDEYLYIYAQTMDGRRQYGLVAGAYVNDYLEGKIKKHELTRKDKEEDRMKHVRVTNANIEPVFFSYKKVDEINAIIDEWVKNHSPEYDFTSEDGIGHHLWVIDDMNKNAELIRLFKEKVDATYVADGHHRTAAAALVGAEKQKNNPNHTGKEEYNYFMAVHFPDDQLHIIDYNRVVKDLNGLSEAEFLNKLTDHFTVTEKGSDIYKPAKLHEFSMYLSGKWYALEAKNDTYDDNDPIKVLDVTVSSTFILDKILGIKDLRTDKRIDFVGGIRGLGELKRRVDTGEMKVAFALYPVTMQQLIDIADAGLIMPPKTTWFEPKLRSGLVIHPLD